MIADEIRVEWDEDGMWLILDTLEHGQVRVRVRDVLDFCRVVEAGTHDWWEWRGRAA